jgi:MFS family permease
MKRSQTLHAPPPTIAFPSVPRLPRSVGLWAIAGAFLVITAFSTAPSSLYGLYAQRDHFAPLTITLIYAAYAVGVVVSLILAGHLSDSCGRRPMLLAGLLFAIGAAVVFIVWRSLAGLIIARVTTGLAVGISVATATAFIADLDTAPGGAVTRRSGIVATVANIGGLALGPVITGLLASYGPDALTLPFVVFLVALVVAAIAVTVSPEGRAPAHPTPRCRPQRLGGAGQRPAAVQRGGD